MLVWLNGTFGVGKTTTGRQLVTRLPGFRPFGPEWVGFMLASNLGDHKVSDFQQYPSWRRLVPAIADEVGRFTGQQLVVAQTVLVEEYWRELSAGPESMGHDVFHVLLDADAETLHARIDADTVESLTIRPWRHDHVEPFQAARSWMVSAADLVVDTTCHGVTDTADQIVAAVRQGT